jgi:hypothetical protein
MRESLKHTAISRSDPQRVKIYGERNTGTSYLEELLVRNLVVECLRGGVPRSIRRSFANSERARDWYFRVTQGKNLGWKHAYVAKAAESRLADARADATDVLYLTLTKNPYAWLLSLYRQPYHAKQGYSNFGQFLTQPWKTVGRENAPPAFANPVEMWNLKNAAYLELGHSTTTVHCRYEDLLADPLGFLEKLSCEHAIQTRQNPFENVLEAMKRQGRGKTFDDYRTYYLEQRWLAELDDACIELINERLDFKVLAQFGYSRTEARNERPLTDLTRATHD